MSKKAEKKTLGRPFPPGQSGNPGGRPKALKAVEELARSHTTSAVSILNEIAKSKRSPAAARVSACIALLDRGWGKPKQAIEATMSFDLAEMMRQGRERVLKTRGDAE